MHKNHNKQKSILITGASSGIGRALAVEFARRGYKLGLCARRLNRLQDIRYELRNITKVAISKLDITNYDEVRIILKKLNE